MTGMRRTIAWIAALVAPIAIACAAALACLLSYTDYAHDEVALGSLEYWVGTYDADAVDEYEAYGGPDVRDLERMIERADMIAIVQMEQRAVSHRALCSTVRVVDVLKGDSELVGSYQHVYEPCALMRDGDDHISGSGAYALGSTPMLPGRCYVLALTRRRFSPEDPRSQTVREYTIWMDEENGVAPFAKMPYASDGVVRVRVDDGSSRLSLDEAASYDAIVQDNASAQDFQAMYDELRELLGL